MAVAESFGDLLALKIQELRRHQDGSRPLVRIDNREMTITAPFQFDAVAAILHRNGCRAIPSSSRTALYGLWRIPPLGQESACPVCRPGAGDGGEMADEGVTDYVYGLLSVLDQFGSVIRERGREFRESEEGRQFKAGFDGLYRGLEERERATLKVVLDSLDGLLTTLVDIDKSLDSDPAHNGSGAASPNGHGPYNGDAGHR